MERFGLDLADIQIHTKGDQQMASLLNETAESLKAKGIRIESWDEDPRNGKNIGFRCGFEQTRWWVSALKQIPRNEKIGVMDRLATKAAKQEAMLLIRIGTRQWPGNSLVFHPDAYLDHGERYTADEGRKQRGERWINLPASWGCRLSGYVDGTDEPRVQPTEPEEKRPDGGWF